tara:strand:- start:104 stop:1789 length:1686 start_codon:yes stop_codon:yes gene_type:complete
MKNLFIIFFVLLIFSCSKEENLDIQQQKYSLKVTLNPSTSGTLNVSSGDYYEGTEVEIKVTPNSDFEFKDWTGDGSGNQNPLKVIMNSNKSITGNLNISQVQSIEIINPIDTLVISRRHKFEVKGTLSNGNNVDLTDQITLQVTDDKVTLIENNEFTVGKSGETSIKVKYKDFELSENIYSSNIEYIDVGSELISSDNCNNRIPIVIINYFPTSDGVNHDENIGPSGFYYLRNPSVETSRNKVHSDLVLTKRVIEYGSRYRDYGSSDVNPYICMDVVKYINLYELDPYVKLRPQFHVNDLDYFKMFEKINMKDLVNIDGVKEVWITIFPKSPEYPSVQNNNMNDPETYYTIPESNMSSPNTGDISNSYRIPEDLPIYDNTYVVYGYNGHRGADTNIHNRGHQIKTQMMWLEQRKSFDEKNQLFWNNFVGSNDTEISPIGRAGRTHFPPNTSVDYDYCNESLVESDIMNWTPSGGEKELVNCNTWNNLNYIIDFNVIDINNNSSSLNRDPQTKWLLYWFQSIPGENNNIPFERDGVNYKLTNWWALFYNWDETINNDKTLWE